MAHCIKCAHVSLNEIVPAVKRHATLSYGEEGKGIQVFCLTTAKFVVCTASLMEELSSMKN